MNFDVPASADEILEVCEKALSLAPALYPPTLRPFKELPEVPDWDSFEHEAWGIGESVRRSFVQHPKFKKNDDLLNKVVEVAVCRNLRRGRQSFVMALGFVVARQHAKTLSRFLNDPDVDGQVVYTLIKMKAPGFILEVKPLLQSDKTWIRNLAKKYLGGYGLPSF